MEYTEVVNDEDLIGLARAFSGLERIAVDFECEFNLHVYGEHLCLVQINDGKRYYLVDVLSKGITERGLRALFETGVKKLFFDCKSDHMLLYKNYGIRIENIFDIRALALALGFTGNLSSLKVAYLNKEENSEKKKNQRANWMRRPLSDEMIEYALEDVDGLFELEDILTEEVEKRHLQDNAKNRLKNAAKLNEIVPQYENIPGYSFMNKMERIYLKCFFEERDRIARKYNVPASRVMDKKLLLDFVSHPPKNEKEIVQRLENVNPRFKWNLKDALKKGLYRALEEISSLEKGQ